MVFIIFGHFVCGSVTPREGWERLSGGYLPRSLRLRVDDLLRRHVSVMEDSAGAELPKKL